MHPPYCRSVDERMCAQNAPLLLGAVWSNLVQLDTTWFSLVQLDPDWSSLAQLYAGWCNLVQIDAT